MRTTIEYDELKSEGLDLECVDLGSVNLSTEEHETIIPVRLESGVRGDDGVSVVSVKQIESSQVSEGTNVIEVSLSDGKSFSFVVKNGSQGERGVQGEQGIQGIRGERGEKGDTGERGIKGERGLQGIQGIQGIQGVKGDKGDSYILTSADKKEIASKVDVTGYATQAWVIGQGYINEHQSLSGYATESWVSGQGFVKDISGKQDKITESSKLPYSLISGTPTIPSLDGYATENYVNNKLGDIETLLSSI